MRKEPSTIVPVRFHQKELKLLDKNRKKKTRSEYIREMTLTKAESPTVM